MKIVNVWKEKSEPLTWRHFVVAVIWALGLIPMVLLFVTAALAEKADETFGKLRPWANPQSYARRRR